MLLPIKTKEIYDRLCKKLLEIEQSLNPSTIMIDFKKAALNALEENFISVIMGCFGHLSQNIFRHLQEQGLVARYHKDNDFAIKIRMLVSLAFVQKSTLSIGSLFNATIS